MSYPIVELEGIGPALARRLAKVGIRTTSALLEQCGHRQGRKAVARATGCSEARLLKWANMADLMRISGVGQEFSELLEAAGVDTVKQLRKRNARNLALRLHEVNAEKRLTRRRPAESMVERWVEEAKTLPPTISH